MPRRLILILGLVGLQALALVVVLGITYWASQGVLLRFAEGLTARIARDTTAYTENFLDPAEDAAQLSQRLLEAGVVPHDDTEALGRLSPGDSVSLVYRRDLPHLIPETGDGA